MAIDKQNQYIVWQRYTQFQKMGMKESYVILFNGWLIMDYVFEEVSDFFLTNKFLE